MTIRRYIIVEPLITFMPMQNIFTPFEKSFVMTSLSSDDEDKMLDSEIDSCQHSSVGPKASTLAFLRQYARCYQPQLLLPYPLSEFVAN